MYQYQKTNRYFAQISDSMEDLGKNELIGLGAKDVTDTFRGVYFSASKETLYRVNYLSRFLTRIIAPLISFDCHSTKYLYKTAREINWCDLFDLDNTFAVFANVHDSNITHSQYAALCLKDAIVDSFRDKYGKRPDVEPHYPDVWFNLYINKNKAVISIETSGGSLHRRGYRKESVEAPIQETVAAAVVEMSGWDGKKLLYDPFCGSGTLLCEAMMKICNIPAGYLKKKFGFRFLPDFDYKLWKKIKTNEDKKIKELPSNLIYGSDISAKSIRAAKINTKMLPGGHKIGLRTADFRDLENIENSIIICNPPYGMRLKNENTALLIKDFGDFLKQKCKNTNAYIYFGNRELIKKIGLRSTWKKPLKNGGLDGRLVKYEMY